jgi:hypothetical protein
MYLRQQNGSAVFNLRVAIIIAVWLSMHIHVRHEGVLRHYVRDASVLCMDCEVLMHLLLRGVSLCHGVFIPDAVDWGAAGGDAQTHCSTFKHLPCLPEPSHAAW